MHSHITKLYQLATKPSRRIIGLMSGTSLDGLDIALCDIRGSGQQSSVKVERFITVPYTEDFRSRVQAGRVELSVRNSVPAALTVPGVARPGHGMALRNVRQRLKLMHDVEADFEAGLQRGDGERQPGVYVVRLSVPLRRTRP